MVWGLNRLSNLFFWPQLYNNILIFSFSCVRAAFQLMPAGGLKYLPNPYQPTMYQDCILICVFSNYIVFYSCKAVLCRGVDISTSRFATFHHQGCHLYNNFDWLAFDWQVITSISFHSNSIHQNDMREAAGPCTTLLKAQVKQGKWVTFTHMYMYLYCAHSIWPNRVRRWQ